MTFARNRLVVIVPKANPAKLERFADLQRPGVKLVVADPTVPVGKYARSAFAAMNGKDGLPAEFAATVEKNIVSNELDVKAVATKITLGEGDAGVVYATDVTPNVAAAVTVIDVPPAANPDATYPIGVLTSASNPSGAQAFVQFIVTDGQPFLKARGFH
jgi:molybdate transport system substrate-binding protein